jgi:Nucleotide modification associated domain 2
VAKHYVYRMDHDTGFAPRVASGICPLCGCKTTTIETWAESGSWVIGMSGKGTGRPGALIYAMRVESTPTLAEFRRTMPRRAAYLGGRDRDSRVLMSRHFY